MHFANYPCRSNGPCDTPLVVTFHNSAFDSNDSGASHWFNLDGPSDRTALLLDDREPLTRHQQCFVGGGADTAAQAGSASASRSDGIVHPEISHPEISHPEGPAKSSGRSDGWGTPEVTHRMPSVESVASGAPNRVHPRPNHSSADFDGTGTQDVSGQAVSAMLPDYDGTPAVDSQHLRAARALLGWAMSDLAVVSGLSLSTIRRLEQSARAVSPRNHRAAVDALRMAGIRFFILDDGTTALAGFKSEAATIPRDAAPGDASSR